MLVTMPMTSGAEHEGLVDFQWPGALRHPVDVSSSGRLAASPRAIRTPNAVRRATR